MESLSNEQYLFFCVGVSTAFSLMRRLDRLMYSVKQIVGEQYHIEGIGLVARTWTRDDGGTETPPRPILNSRPSKDV